MAVALGASDLKRLLGRAHQRFWRVPGFRGIDVGYRWRRGRPTSEIALRVHVEAKLSGDALLPDARLPTTFDGAAVDVIEGPYRVTRGGLDRGPERRHPYVMGGLACGRQGGPDGTIGALVIDRATGAAGILSNWHVLSGFGARVGDAILQPGESDGGRPAQDKIAVLSRSFLDRGGDAAFATLTGQRPWLPAQIRDFTPVAGPRAVRLGEVLVKTGRTTGTTEARVDGIGIYRLDYQVGPNRWEPRDVEGFKLVPILPGNPSQTALSGGGDSGALWMSALRREAVGLHFGGEAGANPLGEPAIACHMETVLQRLGVRLATPEDLVTRPVPQTRHQAGGGRAPWFPGRAEAGSDGPLRRAERVAAPRFGYRYDVEGEIWPRLQLALMDFDEIFDDVKLVTPLIQAFRSKRAAGLLAEAINASDAFVDVALRAVGPEDFAGVERIWEVCQRLNDILAEGDPWWC